MTHDQHLLLLNWQLFNIVSEFRSGVPEDLLVFLRLLSKLHGIEESASILQHNFRVSLVSSEIVNCQVMGNAANPGQELAFLIITTTTNCVDSLYKCFLQ